MDALVFVCDCLISVARQKILSMFKNFVTNKCSSQLHVFVTIRSNTFINRKSSHSVRQHTLEIAAVSKFAYHGQLICISSER